MTLITFLLFVGLVTLFAVYSVKVLNTTDKISDELDDVKQNLVYVERRTDELYAKIKDLESSLPRPQKMKVAQSDIILEKVV